MHFCPNSSDLINCWGGIHHSFSVIWILWSYPSCKPCSEMTFYWFHGACVGLAMSVLGDNHSNNCMPLLLMALLFDHLTDQLTTSGCHTGVKNPNEGFMTSWNQYKTQTDLLLLMYNKDEKHSFNFSWLYWHKPKPTFFFCVFFVFFVAFAAGLGLGPRSRGSTELHIRSLLNMAAYMCK